MKKLEEMKEQGYAFIEESYYGDYDDSVCDFEEVIEAYEDAEEDEYLTFHYEILEDIKEVHFWIENDD